MSNRFYRAPGEESDDDDDDNSKAGSDAGDEDEDEDESDKKKVVAPAKTAAAAKPAAAAPKKSVTSGMFGGDKSIKVESSDDDDDKEKRKVVSAKDKKMASLLSSIKAMNNARKIANWVKVLSEWQAIDVHLAKLMKEPEFRKEGVPKVYWQQLLGLDTLIRKQKEDEKKAKEDDGGDAKSKPAAAKKMNADQARAQTRLHSDLKKLIKQYEKQLTEYKKAPLPDAAVDVPAAAKKKKGSDDDDDDDDEAGDEDEDGDDNDSDGDRDGKALGKNDDEDEEDQWDESDDDDKGEAIDLSKTTGKQFTREYWMKKPGAPDSDDEAAKKPKPKVIRKQGEVRVRGEVPAQTTEEEQKKKKAEVEWTPEMVLKKLAELVSMRGKKGTDRQLVVSDLKLLATKSTDPATLLKVNVTLCSALFDITLNTDSHMPIPLWHEAHQTLGEIVKILSTSPLVRLSEDDLQVEESFDLGDNEDQKLIGQYITSANAQKVDEEKKKQADEEKKLKESGQELKYVMGNLYSFVDRMASEFKKSLQNLDPHAPEYVARLKDEPLLLSLVERVQDYYFKIQKVMFQCKVVLLRLEHTYYHYTPSADVQKVEATPKGGVKAASVPAPQPGFIAGLAKSTPFGARAFLNLDNPSQVQTFAMFLYKNADDRTRMRALLYHVYYLSIHNRYAEARDLLLMSHVQDGINEVDIATRIIFNRTMAQLGLCAFRVGEYRQALYCLTDLHLSKNIKELIAQGTSSRYFDRDPEKEKLEKKRLYPYHQHMSMDMLEAVHLLSAMFVEVPNIAIYGTDNKRRIISKTFRRLFDHHQRQAFNGPPENTRDLIMGATKSLRSGEWQKGLKYVMRLKMWELVPNAESVKVMVTDKLKEEALRTYLFTFATQYVSISLHTLMSTFELAANVVYRITSKMMVNEQLQGTWDQPTASIVMHANEPTPLQRAALKYADKATVFLEQNERAGETRAAPSERPAGEGTGERARTGYGGYGGGYQPAADGGEGGSRGRGRGGYRGRGRGGGYRGRSNNTTTDRPSDD